MGNLEWKKTYKSMIHNNLSFVKLFSYQYLPWADGRPYQDGIVYNCLVIDAKMKDTGKSHYNIDDLTVIDEVLSTHKLNIE